MRWQLSDPLVAVQSDVIDCVEGQQLVRIHCYQDRSRVSLENSCERYLYKKTCKQEYDQSHLQYKYKQRQEGSLGDALQH